MWGAEQMFVSRWQKKTQQEFDNTRIWQNVLFTSFYKYYILYNINIEYKSTKGIYWQQCACVEMYIKKSLLFSAGGYSSVYIGQASPPLVAASQIHNDWRLPPASERVGHTAANHSESTPSRQTYGGNTGWKTRNLRIQARVKSD